MPVRKRILLGIAAIGALLALPLGTRVLTRVVEERAPLPALAPEGEARLLADLERAQAAGFFAGRGHARDAAPVLNHLVRADAEMEGTTPAWWAEGSAFEDLLALRKEGGDYWLAHPEITGRYDLTFLAEWRAFDHWAWDAADPFRAHRAAHPEECPVAAPIPNFIPLTLLAKVRMAQGVVGDLDAAMQDTEQLALLAHGTDTLVGAMVAVSILGIEARAIEKAVADGKVAASPRPTWTEDERKRLKAALMATAGVYTTDPSSALAQTLASRAGELPGVCAAIAEGAVVGSMLRPFVADPWPAEPDHSALASGIEDALARSGCPISYARAAWENGLGAPCFTGEGWDERMLRVPYLRSPVVASLRTLATPSYLGTYQSGAPTAP